MPSMVNELLHSELEAEFKEAGSCLILSFDKLTVGDVSDLRGKFREAGVSYKVVKNRLAVKAAKQAIDIDISDAFDGKCGIVFAPEERAISAAKIVREFALKARKALKIKKPPLIVTGGVIEGEAITGAAAAGIADMPDKDTIRSMLLSCIQGPSRSIAACLNGLPAGLARVTQAHIEKGEDS